MGGVHLHPKAICSPDPGFPLRVIAENGRLPLGRVYHSISKPRKVGKVEAPETDKSSLRVIYLGSRVLGYGAIGDARAIAWDVKRPGFCPEHSQEVTGEQVRGGEIATTIKASPVPGRESALCPNV